MTGGLAITLQDVLNKTIKVVSAFKIEFIKIFITHHLLAS